MKFAKILFAIASLIISATVLASGDLKPKHGGQVQEVSEVQYEVVVKPDNIAI